MWRPELRRPQLPGALAVAGLILMMAASPPAGATAPPAPFEPAVPTAPARSTPPAPPAAPEIPEPPSPPDSVAGAEAARALGLRYSAEALSDAVLLRPRAESSAVRSIELTEDGETLVNGKTFAADELEEFLGDDGRRLSELSRLDFDQIRRAFGFETEDEEIAAEDAGDESDADESGEDEEEVSVEIPGVPGGRLHVRHSRDDRVSFGNSIHLDEGETANEVVCIGCSVVIEGETSGDTVAVGGSVRVTGRVGGNAVAVGGGLKVEDGGVIEGDGVSVGGSVQTEEGGSILGQRSSVGVGGWGDGWMSPFAVFSDVGKFVTAIFRTGVLTLLAVLCLYLMRPAVERVSRRVTLEPWKAVLAGLLVQLFFFPVLIIVVIVLAVSVIGIPLLALVPVALLAFVIGSLLGFVAVAREVGRWVERRTSGRFSSEILTVVIGVLLIQAVSLVGRLVSLPGGVLAAVGFSIVALGFFIKYVAWTAGMGAMTLVAFGRDWRRPMPAAVEPPPAPPVAKPEPDSLSIVPPTPPPPRPDPEA